MLHPLTLSMITYTHIFCCCAFFVGRPQEQRSPNTGFSGLKPHTKGSVLPHAEKKKEQKNKVSLHHGYDLLVSECWEPLFCTVRQN
ncbi:hypothetical protein GGU10DRAFT_355829 [Lentinula aff. detonsa]|uniref:Secreted protein n=1 Tax=Lentinula aff. detonsa TaxID=2804958 RepID=A0AA38NJ61_9AGAR|nr:hypothetical protein GGU10DRAFT_355829 [Lentinula aff. detonsa]